METRKKLNQKILLSLITMFLVFQIIQINTLNVDSSNPFSNQLEASIKNFLAVDDLTNEDYESVELLNLSNMDISDLSGIDKFVNLKELNLNNNKISDISILSQLENLETVSVLNQTIEVEVKGNNGEYVLENLVVDESGMIVKPSTISHDGYYEENAIIWRDILSEQSLDYTFETTIQTNVNSGTFSGSVFFKSQNVKVEDTVEEQIVQPDIIEDEEEVEFEIPFAYEPGSAMKDVNLKIALNDILGKGTNVTTELTDEEIAQLPSDLDLSHRGVMYLDGLDRATHLTSLDLSNNNIRTADELDKISSLTIHTINLTNFTVRNGGIANPTSELRLQNFSNLKTIIVTDLNRNIGSIVARNLPEVEKLIFGGSIYNSDYSAQLVVENLPKLTDIDFGSPHTHESFSPRSIVLRDLPLFEMKSHIVSQTVDKGYHWYLGVSPILLRSITIENVPKVKYFDTMEVYDEILGDDVINHPDELEFRRPVAITEANFINLDGMIEIDLTENVIANPVFSNLPALETLILTEMRLKTLSSLEGLQNSTKLNYIDISSYTASSSKKNALVSSDELKHLNHTKAKKVNITNAFVYTVKDIVIEDLVNIEEIIIDKASTMRYTNLELRNLPKVKEIDFSNAIYAANTRTGKLVIENLPLLHTLNLGMTTNSSYYASPKELVLKDLPNLVTKAYPAHNTYSSFYWGVGPYYLQTLTLDNIGSIPYFNMKNIPDEMKDASALGKNNVAPSGKLATVKVVNNDSLKELHLSDQVITFAEFSNLPDLGQLSIDKNQLSTLSGMAGLSNSVNLKELNLTKNKISNANELSNIEDLPIQKLTLIDTFVTSVDDLIVENFKNLKELVLIDKSVLWPKYPTPSPFTNVTLRNLPAIEHLDLTMSFKPEYTSSGTLIIENLENLKSAQFGGKSGQRQFMSPKKLVLKDLPQLEVKSYVTLNAENWYLGIDPGNLVELEIDNVHSFKNFDTVEIAPEMIGEGSGRTRAAYSDMLRKVTINNVPDMHNINIPKKQLLKAHFTNLDGLKTVDVSSVFSSGHGTLEDLHIENTTNLESLNFDNNLVTDINFLKDVLTTSTSSSVTISGNKNHIYDARPVKIVKNNQTISLKDQTPDLPDVLNNVGATGVYDFDSSEETFISPYSVIYSDISHGGIANGSRISFRDLEYNDPTSFTFKWVSEYEESAMSSNFVFTGHARQSLNYPLESFSGTLTPSKEKSFYTDTIEYTLTFTPNGMDGLPIYDGVIDLLVPEKTKLVSNSITVSDGVFTINQKQNNTEIEFEVLNPNQEYIIKYTVKVDTKEVGQSISAAAVVGKDSYVKLDVNNSSVLLVDSYSITEQYEDRNGVSIKDSKESYVIEDATFNGTLQTISNFVYVGYRIGDEDLVETTNLPVLSNLREDSVITYVYGVEDSDNEGHELIHVVNESYVNRNNDSLSSSIQTNVYSTTPHDITIKTITDYIYVGYHLNNGPLTTGTPDMDRVENDTKIVYVYGFENPDQPGTEVDVIISELYVDRKGREIDDKVINTLKYHESFSVTDEPSVENFVYLGYKENGGALITNQLPSYNDIKKNIVIEYVFGVEDEDNEGQEKVYKITEKHVNRKNVELISDTFENVYAMTDYNGSPQSVDNHIYIGYILEDKFVKTSEYPVIVDVEANQTVIYVYGVEDDEKPGFEKQHTVLELYVDRDFDALIGQDQTTLYELEDYKGISKTVNDYVYIGYQIDENPVQYTSGLPEIIGIQKAHTVKFIYGYEDKTNEGTELTHTVIQRYVNRNDDDVANTINQTVYSHTRFIGQDKIVSQYNYLGYSINGGPLQTGSVNLKPVDEDLTITYLYGYKDADDETDEQKVVVEEIFKDRKGREIDDSINTTKFYHESFERLNKHSIDDYVLLGYSIDGGPFVDSGLPKITDMRKDYTITYLYGVRDGNSENELIHTVKENYIDRNGQPIFAAKEQSIYSRTDYVGSIKLHDDFVYVGYIINDQAMVETKTDVPAVVDLDKNLNVKYVYGVKDPDDESNELIHVITEKYVNRHGDEIRSETSVSRYSTTPYVGDPKEVENYMYLAYSVDGSDFVFEDLNIDSVTKNLDVVYLYGFKKDDVEEQEVTIYESFKDRKGRNVSDPVSHEIFYHESYNPTVQPIVAGYVYLGYEISNRSFVSGMPSIIDLKNNVEITYYFGYEDREDIGNELMVDVIEKHQNRKGDELSTTGTVTFEGLTDYQTVEQSISQYIYVGYIIDGKFTSSTEAPLLVDVIENVEVIHVYGIEDIDNPGLEKTFSIFETYVDRNGEELSEQTISIAQYGTYTGDTKTLEGFVLVGYTVDGVYYDFVDAPILADIESDHDIQYVYGVEDDKKPGEELTHTVYERYETRKGLMIDDEQEIKIHSTTPYVAEDHYIASFVYIGYRINDGELVETSELPRVDRVERNYIITFVYGYDDGDGLELTHEIIQKYQDDHFRDIKDSTSMAVNHMTDYFGLYDEIDGYTYIGYIIDDLEFIKSDSMPTITDVASAHTVTYVYNDKQPPVFVIEEQFVDTSGRVIKASNLTQVKEFESYSKKIENLEGYKFIGYEIDGENRLSGDVVIDEVLMNHTIKFIYERNETTPPTGIQTNVIAYVLTIVSMMLLLIIIRKKRDSLRSKY